MKSKPNQNLKILAIGDFHGKFPEKLRKEAKKADLILCTGDLGGSKELLNILFRYFKQKWWEKIGEKRAKRLVFEDYNRGKKIIKLLGKLNKEVYIIPGNWDFYRFNIKERTAGLRLKNYYKIMREYKNLHLLRRNIYNIFGLRILSFGNMVTAGSYTLKGTFKEKERKRYIKKEKKEIKQILKFKKQKLDIIFTHYPPYGLFDKVRYKGYNPMNGKHIGFRGFVKAVKKYKPSLLICGHMHEYQRKERFVNTLIVATGSAQEGKAALIEMKKKKVNNVKFIR